MTYEQQLDAVRKQARRLIWKDATKELALDIIQAVNQTEAILTRIRQGASSPEATAGIKAVNAALDEIEKETEL